MLQGFILGKKCLFFSFLNALGNVIQQECSQELLVEERRMVLSRGPHVQLHPCAQPPGSGSGGSPGRPTPALHALPHTPGEAGPARPHGSTMCQAHQQRGQKPGEGRAAHGAAPAVAALGLVSSQLCQWPFPLPALDGVTRNAGSPRPVVCHHLNLSLTESQSDLLFLNTKAPTAIPGEAGLPPACWWLPRPPALPPWLLLGCPLTCWPFEQSLLQLKAEVERD